MIVQGDETDQQGEMLAHIENIDETGTDFEINIVLVPPNKFVHRMKHLGKLTSVLYLGLR